MKQAKASGDKAVNKVHDKPCPHRAYVLQEWGQKLREQIKKYAVY